MLRTVSVLAGPVLVGLALAATIAQAALVAPQLSIISIPTASRAQLDALQKRVSLDIIDVKDGQVTACVNPEEIKLLKSERIPYTVVNEDANELVAENHLTGTGAYHTYDSVNAELREWATKLPDVVKLETIGTSVEGRGITALSITAPGATPAAERPKMLIMGLHHAREWISVEVPMALIKKLLDGWSANDSEIRNLLATRNFVFVPIVNPDGFVYSQTSSTMWRKNRHDTSSLPGVNGVDPNRNYGFEWVGSGSSTMPFSETYRGTAPFSEPETQAIKALAEREKFVANISYHSYSELVLFPWGYQTKVCKDDATFRKVATEMGRITKYRPQTGADLYLVNGEADDFLYGALGAWAFTVELGKQFIPKDKDIPGIVGPNVEAALYVMKNCDHLQADPGIMLHLVERLAGAAGSAKGPWSPGAGDEAFRQRTLDWAARELGQRLSAMAQTQGRAAIEPYLSQLAAHAAGQLPELKAAARAAIAAAH